MTTQLSPELLKRIRQIELRTRRLVNDSFAGAYHSVFKGQGIVFDAVRPYQAGDDVRMIDWKVTARSGEAYIKRYVEERELTVMIVLDTSASCLFGTVNKSKRDLAAEIGAVLALSAISNNDKVGLLIFSDKVELFIPPRKGRNHVLLLIRDLLAVRPSNQGTDLGMAFRTLNRVLNQKSVVFFMSDFLENVDDYRREMMVTAKKHDMIGVVLSDPLEETWMPLGLVGVHDAETGVKQWVDTSSRQWREKFEDQTAYFGELRDQTLLKSGVDRIDIPVDGDYVRALMQFFQKRSRRSR